MKKKLSLAFVITAILILTATAALATSLFNGYFGSHTDLKAASIPSSSVREAAPPTDEIVVAEKPEPGEKLAQWHAYDANPGQILRNALYVLTETNFETDKASQYTASGIFIWSDQYCGGTEPVWIVTLSLDNTPVYKVMLGYDGKFVDCKPVDQDFTNVWRRDEQLGFTNHSEQFNAQGAYFYDWTLEEKALFSRKWVPAAALFLERNPYFTGEGNAVWAWTRRVYGLPDDGGVTQDQALSLVRDAASQLGAGDEFVQSPDHTYIFYDVTDEGKPLWLVILTREATPDTETEDTETRYYVTIDAQTGAVLEAYEDHSADGIDNFLSKSSQEDRVAITKAKRDVEPDTVLTDRIPAEHHSYDATEEEALAAARAALTGKIGITPDDADTYAADAVFFYSVWYNWGEEPVWLVTYSLGGIPTYKVLLGYDASYIDWAPVGQEFTQLYRMEDDIGNFDTFINEQEVFFFDWTLEEKTAFSEKWIPLAEAYKATHPYFTGNRSNFWQWTRRVFGLPSETDIQRDEALAIAKESLKYYGETDETFAAIDNVEYFFDVTEPEQPQWRMCVEWLADFEHHNVENERHYLLKIDAVTGEVLEILVCPLGIGASDIFSSFISEP